jgi:hypothetical protein
MEHVTRASTIFGDVVPRFKFRDLDAGKPEEEKLNSHAYVIENVRAIDGELDCVRKNDRLSSLRLDVSIDGQRARENALAIARFLLSVHAVTWAYTEWPKEKVQKVLSDLVKKANQEAQKSELRGDAIMQGDATYDMGGGIELKYWAGGGLTFGHLE